MKNGLTLIEILVTLIMIAFIISLTMPSYNRLQERSKDKEALSSLKRIQETQGFLAGEINSYYPSAASVSTINSININLRLALSTASTRDWNYTVYSNGCGRATRISSDTRNWYLRINDDGRDPSGAATDGEPEIQAGLSDPPPGYTSNYTCP